MAHRPDPQLSPISVAQPLILRDAQTTPCHHLPADPMNPLSKYCKGQMPKVRKCQIRVDCGQLRASERKIGDETMQR